MHAEIIGEKKQNKINGDIFYVSMTVWRSTPFGFHVFAIVQATLPAGIKNR